ncbi:DUF5946 family protein [Gaopeijia maritima]|uniref:DUF5946 family protein n=1 Tax=Gaopeijia maritima TaxID=3119007 RepID=UPI0032557C9F
MMESLTPTPCPGCGLVRPPDAGPSHDAMRSSPGCWKTFTEVLGREYGDPDRWAVHALTVDSWGAQHPGKPSAKNARLIGGQLLGLALVLERGVAPEDAGRKRRTVLDRLGDGLVWLAPPDLAGAPTVAEVAAARDTVSHVEAVHRWARGVWQKWEPHHDTLRRWLDWLEAASPPGFLPPAVGRD